MSKKDDLRKQRVGTKINTRSKPQERSLDAAMKIVRARIESSFPGITLGHEKQWKLADVVLSLSSTFPSVEFHCDHALSSMRPDGGILSIIDTRGKAYPILIVERKNQGTNDLRAREKKPKQAKGNAIERLGKNVIGFRAAMLAVPIFPFVCFGDGCDFAPGSSILDRVVTIGMFGKLNVERVQNQGPAGQFNRGTFYFREQPWTESEIADRCFRIARKQRVSLFLRAWTRSV